MTLTGDGTFAGAYTGPEGTACRSPARSTSWQRQCDHRRRRALAAGVDLDDNGMRGDTAMRLIVTGGTANGLTLTYPRRSAGRPALFSNRNACGTNCGVRPAGRVRNRARRWPRAGAALDRPAAHGPAALASRAFYPGAHCGGGLAAGPAPDRDRCLGPLLFWVRCLPDFRDVAVLPGVTYATVGFGDIVLPHGWRLLAPMEGPAGILMCGLSTGFFFVIVGRLSERLAASAAPIRDTSGGRAASDARPAGPPVRHRSYRDSDGGAIPRARSRQRSTPSDLSSTSDSPRASPTPGARPVALRRGLRPARRGHAASRAARSRSLAGLDVER